MTGRVTHKRVICTRADDGIAEMSALTHPIMRRFAEKWEADFIVLNGPWKVSRHYRILALGEILQDYDVALSLDTDMLILPQCPDPFKIFGTTDAIATVFEDVGSRQEDRRQRMRHAEALYGYAGWERGYPNTGFFMVPSSCRRLFAKKVDRGGKAVKHALWGMSGFDDVYLGYWIRRMNLPIVGVSWKWNHMTMFSEPWNDGALRFNSYIIHYAGVGVFDPKVKDRMQQIQKDVALAYGGTEAMQRA